MTAQEAAQMLRDTAYRYGVQGPAWLHVLEMKKVEPWLVGPYPADVVPPREGVYITQAVEEFSPGLEGHFRKLRDGYWYWGEVIAHLADQSLCCRVMVDHVLPTDNIRYWWGLSEELYTALKELM